MPDVIVAGHLCLDLLPEMPFVPLEALALPGRLYDVGPLRVATGGAVSNTGLALHRLGVDVGLMASVGDDLIGRAILDVLRARDPRLAELIAVQPGATSSYSVVLSPTSADRVFLHYTGNNATFTASDVNPAAVRGAKLFHLGYPPLLPRLLDKDGAGLAAVFKTAHKAGAVTSLDMTLPDPNGETGMLDWRRIFRNALPHVDVFVPSIDEALFALRRADFDRWHGRGAEHVSLGDLRDFAGELLALGPAVAGFKLGDRGVYLRVADEDRLFRLRPGGLRLPGWDGAEIYQPAYQVEVAGTTGAGDAAYAALLTAMLGDVPLDEAARWFCAAGACCCEAPDASSGVLPLDRMLDRLANGWPECRERVKGSEGKKGK
jgi:sugar/nucleoside kinase (ribokinase family)